MNATLLEDDVEFSDELREKLPRENLRATDRFDCDFGVQFDFAIAQSLFTHIPLNDIRLCLVRLGRQGRGNPHLSPRERFRESRSRRNRPPAFPHPQGVGSPGVTRAVTTGGRRRPCASL